ncbi:MAG: L-rhamnose mutarotase [Myxococcota bacterium]
MRRFGQTLGIRSECIDEYRRYHARIWPEIESAIRDAGIRNYSIFLLGDRLFAYYEYVGPDDEYEARMEALARAPRMREWWDRMEPLQVPDPARPPGSWWSDMEEVFHQD